MDLDNIKKPTKKNTNIVPFQNILYYLEVKTNKAKSDLPLSKNEYTSTYPNKYTIYRKG